MTTATTKTSYDLASESFNRCSNSDGFFDTFYAMLRESSAEIAQLFLATDFTRQNGLLRVALELMLMFDRAGDAARQALEKTRETHGHKGFNLKPELYDVWLDTLMKACAKHDPEFDAEIEAGWRDTLAPSINFVQSDYLDPTREGPADFDLGSLDPQLQTIVTNWEHLSESVRSDVVARVISRK